MASVPFRSRQIDVEVEDQIAADLNITWETPSTPANPDDYVVMNGLRMAKRRWAGKTVVDLFAQEFRQRPREYYEDAVKLGRIRVEGKMVAPSYVVRDSETMSHFVHRHEPPVLLGPVTILEEGSDVITVCKPASVPVHPCGQYRKNTVMSILEAEHKTGPLFLEMLTFSKNDMILLHYRYLGKAVHRLDRLVSGLLILARNSRTADFFRQEIEAGVVQKQYVAKVKGVFPAEEVDLNAAVLYNPREGKSSVEVPTPIVNIVAEMESTIKGASRQTPGSETKGKESCTRFQRLSTNGVESIVRCMPQTGRTHQIRVHLQHLGFPIANDALYLHSNVAKRSKRNTTADRVAKLTEISETLSRGGTSCTTFSTAEAISSGVELGSSIDSALAADVTIAAQGDVICHPERDLCQRSEDFNCLRPAVASNGGDPAEPGARSQVSNETEQEESRKEILPEDFSKSADIDFVVDPLCTHCPNFEPSGYAGDDEGLWLHCVRYSGTNWAYECPLPQWAL